MFPRDDDLPSGSAGAPDAALAEAIGVTLRGLRGKAGLSMSRLAALSGVSQPFLSQVENGRTTPSLSTLYRLADALGVSPGELLPRASGADVVVTRVGDGTLVPSSDHPHSAIGRVIAAGSGRALEFIEYRVDPAEVLDDWFQFDGELVVYVIEGLLEVEVEGRGVWRIGPREAIHQQAAIRHRWRPVGGEPVSLVFAAVRA